MKSVFRPWLLAACVTLGIGCTGETKNQVITGRITKTGALAVRAVSNGNVITAGRVHSDGTFTIALPKGTNYRLEVLTTAGVKPIVGGSNAPSTVTFKVCEPQNPWDLGGVEDGMGGGTPGCTDPMDPNCTDPDPCDPMDPNCLPPCDLNDPNCWPPECTDPMDPNCKPPGCTDPMDPHCWCTDPNDPNCMPPVCTDPMDPNCQPPPPECTDPMDPHCWPCTDPMDPNCWMPCTDPNDPNCQPPPPECTDPNDPRCKCVLDPMNLECWGCTDPLDPNCWMPCTDPNDPNCGGGGTCDPTLDPMCPEPPPPCTDPMDPNTCKDPCVDDPAICGCSMEDPNCWGGWGECKTSEDGDVLCEPGEGLWPENIPGDFGCTDAMDPVEPQPGQQPEK